MADVHDKATRSYNMSRVKGKNTKPEMLVRRFLHAAGFRYRLHVKSLPGKPDIVLSKYKTAIFIHGCFWHLHSGCSKASLPKTQPDWWREKLQTNCRKDQSSAEQLKTLGWKVLTIWECQLHKNSYQAESEKLLRSILSGLMQV